MEISGIQSKIFEVRGHKVMLDYDLAALYETETKVLKQAVRRNMNRFPSDFLFILTRTKYNVLRSQSVTLETGKGKFSKYLPFTFTKQDGSMLARTNWKPFKKSGNGSASKRKIKNETPS